jgi:hypothetical protein
VARQVVEDLEDIRVEMTIYEVIRIESEVDLVDVDNTLT